MAKRRTTPPRERPFVPLAKTRRVEVGPDGYDYDVRAVAGSRATKTYRCPGCDHEIRPTTAHVVVWPAIEGGAGESAVDDRRHWHTSCWTNRQTRRPTRKWS